MLSDAVRQLLTAELSKSPIIHEYDDENSHRLRVGGRRGKWVSDLEPATFDVGEYDSILVSTQYGPFDTEIAYLLAPLKKMRGARVVKVAGKRPQ